MPRDPQLALWRSAMPAPASRRWRDGDSIAFLGARLTLRLDAALDGPLEAAARVGDALHLPLPPQASERQVQDSAEAWLRRQAEHEFDRCIAAFCQAHGARPPRLQLSFATKGSWVDVALATPTDPGKVKCNWRLIEHPPALIEQTLHSALRTLLAVSDTPDLFAAPMSG